MKLHTFFSVFLLATIARGNDCKLDRTLSTADLNPRTMKERFSDPNIQSIGDAICCLPQDFRDNVMVINHSLSAQQGLRVLLGDFGKHDMMLSISGETNENRNGRYKIEVITQDSESRTSLSEAHFDENKKFKLASNPTKCASCHSGSPTPYRTRLSENRLVFEDFPWVRANSGLFGSPAKECEPISLYLQEIGDHKRSLAVQQDKFRCIDEDLIMNSVVNFSEELRVIDHDKERQKRLLRAHDVEKFSELMLGIFSCIDFKSDGGKAGTSPYGEWIPEPLLSKSQSYAYDNSVVGQSIQSVLQTAKEREARDRAEVLNAASRLRRIPRDQLKYTSAPWLNLDKVGVQCEQMGDAQRLRERNRVSHSSLKK